MHTVTVHLSVRSFHTVGFVFALNQLTRILNRNIEERRICKNVSQEYSTKRKPVLSPIHMHTLIFRTEILKWKVVLLIGISFKI